jgi:electron transfer flavoprotein alpha subunit
MTPKQARSLPEAAYQMATENTALWVYLEHRNDAISSVSLEILGKARSLMDDAGAVVVGLLVGSGIERLAADAIAYGADEVQVIEDPRLASFNVEAYTTAVGQAIIAAKPSILLLGATHDGRDLAGRLAVRLQTGLNADCTDLVLDAERGVLISEVTGFGGGVIAMLECSDRRPQMSTIRPGVFPLPVRDPKRSGRTLRIDIKLKHDFVSSELLEHEEHHGVDLTQADILICGGRGVEGDFGTLDLLAQLLGGVVGATRPPVDDGYIERERQVGQTGVVCRPKVALCLGISGAFHFVVGVDQADLVIAVNSDPEAEIFEYADYGVVADVKEFLPALMQALEAQREQAHA